MTATYTKAAQKLASSNWTDAELQFMAGNKKARLALDTLHRVLNQRMPTIRAARDDAECALAILEPLERRITAAKAAVDAELKA